MRMDISIIIVEYKNIELVKSAISSIIKFLSNFKYEILVISNSQYPISKQKKISNEFPFIKFIYNKDNVGFSQGVNQGITNSCGKFQLLLNPDAKLIDFSFDKAVEFMSLNQTIGIIGPKIIDENGKIQDSSREFMSIRKLILRTFIRLMKFHSGGIKEKKDYSKPGQVDWVSGACMLVRHKAIKHVGLMDERYFMYIEDMDWCRNFWQNGWEIWYKPDWKIEHNASRGSTDSFKLNNKLMWIHLTSFIKYFIKWLKF